MLNYLWAFMMLAGILWAAFNGNLGQVTSGALDSAGEAVKLCITMLGVMSFWTGILEVGRRAGLIEQLAKKMKPVLRFLFPCIPEGHPSLQSIAANMIANMLGLGWAATPAGLKAMEELEELEEERRNGQGDELRNAQEGRQRSAREDRQENGQDGRRREKSGKRVKKSFGGRYPRAVPRGVASDEMCTFLVVNISSLQLIPVNMIAYRTQYASANPLAVVGPALVATAISTLVGVLFCKLMEKRRR